MKNRKKAKSIFGGRKFLIIMIFLVALLEIFVIVIFSGRYKKTTDHHITHVIDPTHKKFHPSIFQTSKMHFQERTKNSNSENKFDVNNVFLSPSSSDDLDNDWTTVKFIYPLENLDEDQQRCGVHYLTRTGLGWEDNINLTRMTVPVFTDFSDVETFANDVAIIIFDENFRGQFGQNTSKNYHVPYNYWWIRRARDHFGINVGTVFSRFQLLKTLKETSFRFYLIVHPKTYVFVTNVLQLIKDFYFEHNLREFYYEGFPHINIIKIHPYVSLEGGILMNRNAVEYVLMSENMNDFFDINYEVDFLIGRIMRKNNIFFRSNFAFRPMNPIGMLRYFLAGTKPNWWYLHEPRDSIYLRPISFGDMDEYLLNNYERPHKIPKIVHQVWFGGGSRSLYELNKKCKDIFEEAGWQYIFWDDNSYASTYLQKENFKRVVGLNGRSDVARYDILLQKGGVYVDSDTICFKPLDELVDKVYKLNANSFISCENEKIAPGTFATCPLGTTRMSYEMFMINRAFSHLYDISKGGAWRTVGNLFISYLTNMWKIPFYVIPSKKILPLHSLEIVELLAEGKGPKEIYEEQVKAGLSYNSYMAHCYYSTMKVRLRELVVEGKTFNSMDICLPYMNDENDEF